MNKKKIAFYHCHTPLHIGSGTTLDIIDLPIQREAHTDFPVMPSTSIKGVIRGEYWINKVDNNPEIPDEPPEECFETINNKKVFKKDNNNEKCKFFDLFGFGDKEGDIIFTDGKIFLFPVKSVKGVFAWITCPLVLERFERDTECKIDLPDKVKNLDKNETIAGKDLLIKDKYLVLEELSFEDISNELTSQDNKEETDILEKINSLLPEGLDEEIPASKIAILSNDKFRYFVKNHTEVNARTRIDQATGTVKEGALWYEELVPAETVFYNLILSRTDSEENLKLISEFIKNHNDSIFQFGGDETLGRGFTKVYIKEE
jgi:CRISPR-associated protein Cmr4